MTSIHTTYGTVASVVNLLDSPARILSDALNFFSISVANGLRLIERCILYYHVGDQVRIVRLRNGTPLHSCRMRSGCDFIIKYSFS